MKNIILLLLLCYFNISYGQFYDPYSIRKLKEGEAKYKKANYKGAIESYNELIKDSYNNNGIYNVYFLRGEAKSKLMDFSGATKDYTKSLENIKDSNMTYSTEAYYNRGIAKDKLKNYEGAAIDYLEAIRHFPFVKTEGWTKRSGEYSSTVYIIAINSLSNQITSSPFDGKLYHFRGIANLESGNKSNACIDFYKAIETGFEGAGSFIDIYCK